ncbi:MAG: hypothetical protein GY705_09955 [Bacteroidetes bacterium]|nr:hypothetical protein [Bacteroidota bacterium]
MKYLFLTLLLAASIVLSCNKKTTQAARQDAIEYKSFQCLGNEPFWEVKITREAIVFSRMGYEAVSFPYVEPSCGNVVCNYQTQAMIKERESKLKITLIKEACSDTMSDEKYDYRSRVEFDRVTYNGCARELKE